jgi:hypothetical protein
VSVSDFTPGQRRTVIMLVIAVVVVFAMLAGFIVTSLRSWESLSPVPVESAVSVLDTPRPIPTSVQSVMSDEGILSQVQAARLFDQIAHQVEMLRGLSPRAEVPLSFLDEREMSTLLRQFYLDRDPQSQLLPYAALGMLPDVPVSVRAQAVAGVYVPEQEQLYVVTGRPQSDADDQALLAYAYAHTLQDQHFDLEGMDARAATTDAALAVQALVAGDAVLMAALYRYESLPEADWERLADLASDADRPGYGAELDHNEVWIRVRRFPYWQGREFVNEVFRAGGWDAVNRAYTNPPRSTEQVLHPERFLEEQDGPTSVVVPDVRAVLGEGWDVLVEDTLGEFTVGLYLDTELPAERAWQAAAGWDGDTFVVWEHGDGRRLLVWRTIWDGNAEAVEFEQALVEFVVQRYLPAWPLDPPGGLPGRWWETGTGAVGVSRAARYVLLVEAPDPNTLMNVMEVLP